MYSFFRNKSVSKKICEEFVSNAVRLYSVFGERFSDFYEQNTCFLQGDRDVEKVVFE